MTLRSSSVSTLQELKAADFRPAAPSGLPDRIRLATPLGNLPFMRLVRPEERTAMSVVFYTWRDVSFALTPLFGGVIIAPGGIESIFVALGAVFCLMTGLTFALPRIVMSNDARPAV